MNSLSNLKPYEVPFDTHRKLMQVVALSKKSFIVMGSLLYDLYQDEKYKEAVGEGINTWDDYLKQPEIGVTVKEASRLMQIYEVFILQYGYPQDVIADIPVKNMHYMLPIVKKLDGTEGEMVEGLVGDATVLSQADFRERIFDVKTEEKIERTYTYLVMRRCVETNVLNRVFDIDSDEILEVFKDKINEQ